MGSSRNPVAAYTSRAGAIPISPPAPRPAHGRDVVQVPCLTGPAAERPSGGTLSESPPFVPDDFDPPTAFTAAGFRLEPLGPEHNERDYAAWTSSMEHIRRSPGFAGSEWPQEMSLDENRGDLERHAADFTERKGFTFTVLDATDDVVGCVYIYPARDDVHDAKVRSWVTETQAARDEDFRRELAEWLSSDAWPFERPLYEPLLG